ncbi:hypothetical protein DM860_008153 [Cuscuta australis]|uniref:Uncharacterized protein n=1 Tax=Cuscuta australis TaxID=267555 RepID=A0A328D7T3_9ASTE|nr:hypothetical protein DM860_008153 [Cuscuta australis]
MEGGRREAGGGGGRRCSHGHVDGENGGTVAAPHRHHRAQTAPRHINLQNPSRAASSIPFPSFYVFFPFFFFFSFLFPPPSSSRLSYSEQDDFLGDRMTSSATTTTTTSSATMATSSSIGLQRPTAPRQ